MALTVTVPATTTKLCSVADVMDELGCSTSDKPTLDNIIQQVSDAIVAYCGRHFAKQTYSETVAGFGDVQMVLAVWPIVSVTSILVEGLPVMDFTLNDPDSGMIYREAGWRWSTVWQGRLSAKPWPYSEKQIFTVEYIAGYDLPDAMIPNLPRDIERAAIIIAKDWFVNRKRNVSISEVRTPDYSAKYLTSEFPGTAVRLLSRHRTAGNEL